jgi:hypothetical protein
MHENIRLNREIWKDRVNILIPILDIPNHHTPILFNRSDAFRFTLQIDVREADKTQSGLQQSYLWLQTNGIYPIIGQEVAYTYNLYILQPIRLLMAYGFVTDHENVHTEVSIIVTLSKDIDRERVLSLCREKVNSI